jgi:hypothetical protein
VIIIKPKRKRMSDQRSEELELLKQQIEQGARWFYWIIGLSLVNAVLLMAGADVHFIIGSSLIDVGAVWLHMDGAFAKIGGTLFLLFAVGLYFFLGKKAHQGSKWAFIIGMSIYLVDGLIYFYCQDILSGLFHLYVLYRIYGGLKAIAPYRALQIDIEINAIVVNSESSISSTDHVNYMPPAEPPTPEVTQE